eukprot:g6480.t1
MAPDAVRSDASLPAAAKLYDLERFDEHATVHPAGGVDLIVEVAHPEVTRKFGLRFLQAASYMVASTSVFADSVLERVMMAEARRPTGHGLVLPSGALWGVRDIQKASASGALQGLTLTMRKHPRSLKLVGALEPVLERVLAEDKQEETLLFEGSARELCPLAPNNVNTVATAALAAGGTLGFDGVRAVLLCDPRLEHMRIDVEATMKPAAASGAAKGMVVRSSRVNPSAPGAVTGTATFAAFLRSLLLCAQSPRGPGDGVHFF